MPYCSVVGVLPWRSRHRSGAIAIATLARCLHEHAIATALGQEAAPEARVSLSRSFRGNSQRGSAALCRRDRPIGAGSSRALCRRWAFAIAPLALRPHRRAIDAVPACAGIGAVPWRYRLWRCPIAIAFSARCYRDRAFGAVPSRALHRHTAPPGSLLASSRFPRLSAAHRQARRSRTSAPRARAVPPSRRGTSYLTPRARRTRRGASSGRQRSMSPTLASSARSYSDARVCGGGDVGELRKFLRRGGCTSLRTPSLGTAFANASGEGCSWPAPSDGRGVGVVNSLTGWSPPAFFFQLPG